MTENKRNKMRYQSNMPTRAMVDLYKKLYNVSEQAVLDLFALQLENRESLKNNKGFMYAWNNKHTVKR